MLNLISSNKNTNDNIAKKRVAILGGSFDPVHMGHAKIVKELVKRFDSVIVVPAMISPFKQDIEAADGEDRLNMLRLALEGIPAVQISDYEINNGDVSYSYLTAQHFAAENVSLSLVIGSEMLPTLPKWKNFEKLKNLVSFYVVYREGYSIDLELVNEYDSSGTTIRIADFYCEDISSALIKVDLAFKKNCNNLHPLVLDYIQKKALYTDYSFIVDRYSEFNMKYVRIEHTYIAIKDGISIAKIYDVNVNDVIIALLLHDIGKYISQKELYDRWGVSLDIDPSLPAPCRHAPIGAAIARHCFGITNQSILAAIDTHTCCAPFMDDLQKIVAIADYIEEGRTYEGHFEVREEAFKDLNLCMQKILEKTIDHLKGQKIYKLTLDAYDYFRILNNQNEKKRD